MQLDKKRERAVADTELISPHGARIEVSKARAESLLSRPGIRFGDGKERKYAAPNESNVVETTEVTGAKPPRSGGRSNSPGEE